jgi:hypothetical protein
MRDLGDRFAAGEPPAGLQPQPLTPLLPGCCRTLRMSVAAALPVSVCMM